MAATKIVLKTTGLHCQSCAKMVDMTVGELDGVGTVSTDHASGETVVSFDDGSVTVEEIVAAIRAAGYDADATAS